MPHRIGIDQKTLNSFRALSVRYENLTNAAKNLLGYADSEGWEILIFMGGAWKAVKPTWKNKETYRIGRSPDDLEMARPYGVSRVVYLRSQQHSEPHGGQFPAAPSMPAPPVAPNPAYPQRTIVGVDMADGTEPVPAAQPSPPWHKPSNCQASVPPWGSKPDWNQSGNQETVFTPPSKEGNIIPVTTSFQTEAQMNAQNFKEMMSALETECRNKAMLILRGDMRLVSVRFNHGNMPGKEVKLYDYCTHFNVNVGDFVVVDAPQTGYTVVEVMVVSGRLPTPGYHKRVVDVVRSADYRSAMKTEDEMTERFVVAAQKRNREAAVQEMLDMPANDPVRQVVEDYLGFPTDVVTEAGTTVVGHTNRVITTTTESVGDVSRSTTTEKVYVEKGVKSYKGASVVPAVGETEIPATNVDAQS